ncbi:MAG: GNAT family N-acetyltransferase [Bacteroidales bacterium]|nr:GNAT family N-acetyltransferase [Bacteroidales bacterium]
MTRGEIILRAVELKDCETIYGYENDISVWTDGIGKRFYSAYAVEQYVLTTQNEDITKCDQFRLMIDIKENDSATTVGCVDLYDMDFVNSKAGVGIYIDKRYRQLGYAGQTLKVLETYIRNILNFRQLYAFIGSENTVSQRLFASCGYGKTAELNDWLKRGDKYFNVFVFQKIFNTKTNDR